MRYLVVGLGNIGHKRQALLGDACVATVDIYNPDADFRSLEDVPDDNYDAAVLAVPNDAKIDQLGYLLRRGKQVLIEKPLLIPDQGTADRLQRLAADHQAGWYTSYNHRFEPLIQQLRDRLHDQQLGRVYYARFFYGNGTAGNVAGTWRDQGLGVIEDLGSHLLDLADFLLDCRGWAFRPWSLERHELRAFDHAVLASADGRVALEVSYLCWKNTFSIDVFGEHGSLHLDGLPKWGPAVLTSRERVFPSGPPRETTELVPGGADVTWERDLEHFAANAATGRTSVETDWWISETLRAVSAP